MDDTHSRLIIDPDLIATCNALGHRDPESGKYIKDSQCDKCLRDIIRYLQNDDGSSRESKEYKVRRSLGQANVVISDFIPLLTEHSLEDEDLFDVILRLLIQMTQPAINLFDLKLPTDKIEKQRFLELIEMVRSVKVALGSLKSLKSWTVLCHYMQKIMSIEPFERNDIQKEMIERILLLIRNLLHAPLDSTFDRSVRGELDSQDRLIMVMEKAGILDILSILVSSEDEVPIYCFHILEISSLMLREQSPEFLAKCFNPAQPETDSKARSEIEREADDHELKLLVNREKEMRQKTRPFYSRFKEATFQVKNLKSLSDKDLIIHKIPSNFEFTTLGLNKQHVRKGKNRADLLDSEFSHGDGPSCMSRSSPEISKVLSKFCYEVLDSYNALMRHTDSQLARLKNKEQDESYYLWGAYFFMEFNRFAKPDITLVTQTFSVKSLHDFHTMIESYMDKLKTEKKLFIAWSRRLHYALKAYRELIYTLAFSDASTSHEYVDVTKSVKTSIFYEDDYRELLLILIKGYNPIKMTRKYLVDLVQTNHIFLKLLKTYCLINERVAVKRKVRKFKPRKKSKKAIEREKSNLEEKWIELDIGLTAALEGIVSLPSVDEDEDVIPLDPTVDFDPDIQKLAIIQRIQRLLKEEKPSAAVALLRNAREAWPEDQENTFGSSGCIVEEEMNSLKEILMSDLSEVSTKEDEDESKKGSDDERSQSPQEEEPPKRSNHLTFMDVFKKYCHPKVVKAHAILLKDYEMNAPETNHAIVKLFHRMAIDLELHGMFFQASLFRIFQNILKMDVNEGTTELVQFARFIVKKFVATLQKNDMLLIECLFWKSASEAVHLDSGYSDFKSSTKVSIDDFPVADEDEP